MARFIPNNVSFDLTTDISRDLVVGLQSITSSESNGSTNLLLPSPHWTFIDSTVPYIELPLDACQSFERVFGLAWNATYGIYVVDDDLHQTLKTRNPTFAFEIGNSQSGGPSVEITLPYSSFYLPFLPFFDSPPLRYFPIQRAANDSQLTLGRAFLQEAYVITDYEHANFSVSQCRFEEPMEQRIVPILPPGSNVITDPAPSPGPTSKIDAPRGSKLGRQEVIGLTVGTTLGLVILVTISFWLYKASCRRRRNNRLGTAALISPAEHIQRSFAANPPVSQSPVPEIQTNSWNFMREVPDTGKAELPSIEKAIELPHSVRSATPIPRRKANAHRSPQRRYGMRFSTTGFLSTGHMGKYWMKLNGVRDPQSTSTSQETLSTVARLKQSYLDRSLPPTPISESPQDFSNLTWGRVAVRQHEVHDQNQFASGLEEDPYRHRRGFF